MQCSGLTSLGYGDDCLVAIRIRIEGSVDVDVVLALYRFFMIIVGPHALTGRKYLV